MIIMSVDVESWIHRPIFDIPIEEQTKELDNGHVLRSTRNILKLFKKYRTKATFFVLGTIAEWYPQLIQEIKNEGHEIGIHGYTHRRLSYHTKESFDAEIRKTLSILNKMDIIPLGYRSPAFSRAEFLYDILYKYGITYDSSIFPIKTPLYDGTLYNSRPFMAGRGIVEIPCSVLKMSKLRIPVGGFYLRLLGCRMNYFLLKRIEKIYKIAVMYFHPWEILDIPRNFSIGKDKKAKVPFLKRQFAYYQIPMVRELEYLLGRIKFTNFENAKTYIHETFLR
jgi:polysaccharide deacetylase family protein (PEP-CTERM system associated)